MVGLFSELLERSSHGGPGWLYVAMYCTLCLQNVRCSTHSTSIFLDNPFWNLLELRMMEVESGDNWSYQTFRAPVKSSPPTNQHPVFIDLISFLSPNQQCQSIELKETASHSTDLLTPGSPGFSILVFNR